MYKQQFIIFRCSIRATARTTTVTTSQKQQKKTIWSSRATERAATVTTTTTTTTTTTVATRIDSYFLPEGSNLRRRRGFYAAQCQTYHMCVADHGGNNVKASFLCLSCKLFNLSCWI